MKGRKKRKRKRNKTTNMNKGNKTDTNKRREKQQKSNGLLLPVSLLSCLLLLPLWILYWSFIWVSIANIRTDRQNKSTTDSRDEIQNQGILSTVTVNKWQEKWSDPMTRYWWWWPAVFFVPYSLINSLYSLLCRRDAWALQDTCTLMMGWALHTLLYCTLEVQVKFENGVHLIRNIVLRVLFNFIYKDSQHFKRNERKCIHFDSPSRTRHSRIVCQMISSSVLYFFLDSCHAIVHL